MFKLLRELFFLLTLRQRRKLFKLQVLIIIMSFTEIAGVLSIGSFMALVGDINKLQGDGRLATLYQISGLSSPTDFLFWTGLGVLLILVVAALFSMYTIWHLSMYGVRVSADLANRLFTHYMHQPWLFHVSSNSSQLTKQITQEASRVGNGIINPLMQMNAKLIMTLFMVLVILIYNPVVALSGIVIFTSAYFLLYKTVRQKLIANGKEMSKAQKLRFKLMAEGFGGIKDALLLGRQEVFIQQFEQTSERLTYSQGTTQVLSQAPRYAMEVVAFSTVIFLVLYLLALHHGKLGNILPILSMYVLAGFKLLPAFQGIYSSISSIRASLAAFESIRDDLHASIEPSTPKGASHQAETFGNHSIRLVPRHTISLQNIVFTYPGKTEATLNELTLTIPVNKVIGLVGASGSGKSTVIDLLLRLLKPTQGQILIDGEPLTEHNQRAWQNTVGFVPQSIFLSDSSIRENIAFGLPLKEIDEEQVKRAANMAHLDELLAKLPKGLDTRVGERGVQLSGGQRQRIGIARALYHDAEVLVLDEATSALDGITEKLIMDAIHDYSGKKTIIMIAHRLATVKQCDNIYLISQGRVIDQGSYADLVTRNDIFRRMSTHS